MKNLSVRRGETLTLTVEFSDTGLSSARFTARAAPGSAIVLEEEQPFVSGVATIEFTSSETLAVPTGDYVYQIAVEYTDGAQEIYPDTSGCEGDECELPTLTVCASLEPGVS